MTDIKEPIIPEVLDSVDEAELKCKAFRQLKGYADSVANPTAKRYIDWDEFKRAAERFLHLKDIAPLLGVSRDTLNNRCKSQFGMTSREVHNFFAAKGKRVLSSTMYTNAVEKNNTSMQIWLSKAMLGFREPEKKPVVPGGDNVQPIAKIEWAPTIKGFENCSQEQLKDFMGEFLDLPSTHPLKNRESTGKNAGDVPGAKSEDE